MVKESESLIRLRFAPAEPLRVDEKTLVFDQLPLFFYLCTNCYVGRARNVNAVLSPIPNQAE